jgi:hypothetical protein
LVDLTDPPAPMELRISYGPSRLTTTYPPHLPDPPCLSYILMKHHSLLYGTRLIRYPDFCATTTVSLQLKPQPVSGSKSPGSSEKHMPAFNTV